MSEFTITQPDTQPDDVELHVVSAPTVDGDDDRTEGVAA